MKSLTLCAIQEIISRATDDECEQITNMVVKREKVIKELAETAFVEKFFDHPECPFDRNIVTDLKCRLWTCYGELTFVYHCTRVTYTTSNSINVVSWGYARRYNYLYRVVIDNTEDRLIIECWPDDEIEITIEQVRKLPEVKFLRLFLEQNK